VLRGGIMGNLKKWLIVPLALSFVTFTIGGCAATVSNQPPVTTSKPEVSEPVGEYSPKLEENRLVYENDQPGTLVHFYLTITKNNLTNVNAATWGELNKITYTSEDADMQLDGILQEGTAEGPSSGMFEYDAMHPNAVVTLRGKSSSRSPLKSYKIKLQDNAGKWRGQKSVNLLKHPYDLIRVRNTLSFEYFKQIPDFTSLRTQLVQLHVKDLTSNPPSDRFVDYGLFEQIEQPNKDFLRMHGLDPEGHLYKASNFEFYRYRDQLKLTSDPGYDQKQFESILEIKGSQDHSKLLEMVDDVNDMTQNIDTIFDRHFDRDNFLTWTAVNILFDNTDTNTQNFLLYSPLNSDKWFFLPWDYDGAWEYDELWEKKRAQGNWRNGLSLYWGSVLQNRFFKNPKNVEQLTQKMKELKKIITPERTKQILDQYQKTVTTFLKREPDISYSMGTIKDVMEDFKRIPDIPYRREQIYLANLENPMPYFLGDMVQEGAQLAFHWGPSYDLQGDDITYHFQISKDPAFEHIVVDRKGLHETEQKVEKLEQGKYYWRVTAIDSKGHESSSFDELQEEGADGRNIHYVGVRKIFAE